MGGLDTTGLTDGESSSTSAQSISKLAFFGDLFFGDVFFGDMSSMFIIFLYNDIFIYLSNYNLFSLTISKFR
jgi:hypothetical protein